MITAFNAVLLFKRNFKKILIVNKKSILFFKKLKYFFALNVIILFLSAFARLSELLWLNSSWEDEQIEFLSKKEKELISLFRNLSEEKREALLSIMKK